MSVSEPFWQEYVLSMEQNSSTFKNDDNLKPLVVIFFVKIVKMLPDGSTKTVHPLLNMFFSDVQKRSK